MGKQKKKKAYKVSEITHIGKNKKKAKDSDEEAEVVINKKKKKPNKINEALKKEKNKWKDLFKENKVEKTCHHSQA